MEIVDLTTKVHGEDKATHDFRKLISVLFSKPYSPNEAEKDYLPTQYIAEYIKNKGFKGVKYESAVNDNGFNICFFGEEHIDISLMDEITIKSIKYC